ncbi:aspartate carbamoyltransferase [Spirochaeta dissipatitropha]
MSVRNQHPFLGRNVSVVRDLSIDEQRYLYDSARKIKKAILSGEPLDEFRSMDSDLGAYLVFLEDSTRTKESFRNAAKFHGVKVNDFDAKSSSFAKKETLTDTMRMLYGYSSRSIFMVRSRLEGTCLWLHRVLSEYGKTSGLPQPAIINAGDGRHEHPTQEFLDEFSFLEELNWNTDSIHLALVGDLFHGRTVHSKVDGLRIFKKVTVDLIAPNDLRLPQYYRERMTGCGFTVREFQSIDDYLASGNCARLWYFTRLQLERMGDKVRDNADFLRYSVSMRRDHLPLMPAGSRLFHPLPRHGSMPTIPQFLDGTSLNAWDIQSMNGYFTRIALIGMLSGVLGHDFLGAGPKKSELSEDILVDVPIVKKSKPNFKVGIKPVERGIVIDHIGRGNQPEEIWDHIDKIRRILGLHCVSSHGVYLGHSGKNYKGLISIPGEAYMDERRMKMLAAIAPNVTVNMIENADVFRKVRLNMPPRVYGFDAISCRNPDCIAHPDNGEYVEQEFIRYGQDSFVCVYCEKPHSYREIWDD